MPRPRSILEVLLLGGLLVVLVVLVGVAGGCGGRQHYVVQVVPQGDAVQRDLRCWREEGRDRLGPFPLVRLQEVAALYGTDLPDDALAPVSHHFSGTFSGSYGTEGGGRGYQARAVTSLGAVGTWGESQGGEADPAQMRDLRLAALDRALAHAAAFVFHDQGHTAETEALVAFLRSDLRETLRRWLDLLWTQQTLETLGVDDEVVQATMQAHGARLLVERGILEPIDAVGEGDLDVVLEGLVRQAARAMGGRKGEDPPEVLRALLREEDLRERFAAYARTLPGYQQARRRAWAAERATAAVPAPPPDPLEVLREELGGFGFLHGIPFFEEELLELELRLPVPPVETNGIWDETKGVVRWASKVPHEFGLPLLCSATWAEPDVARQERFFGTVVVEGERLVAYVQAHRRLAPEQAERWDAFVESLEPGPGLVARVEAFSASWAAASETEEGSRTPAGRVARCLLEALIDAFPEQVPSLPSPPGQPPGPPPLPPR